MGIRRIDEILAKDPIERTDEEIDYIIEWEVERRFQDRAVQKEEQERVNLHKRLIDAQEREIEARVESLQRMEQAALERLANSDKM